MDYNFVSVERFMELEQNGALLESGTYEGECWAAVDTLHVAEELKSPCRMIYPHSRMQIFWNLMAGVEKR